MADLETHLVVEPDEGLTDEDEGDESSSSDDDDDDEEQDGIRHVASFQDLRSRESRTVEPPTSRPRAATDICVLLQQNRHHGQPQPTVDLDSGSESDLGDNEDNETVSEIRSIPSTNPPPYTPAVPQAQLQYCTRPARVLPLGSPYREGSWAGTVNDDGQIEQIRLCCCKTVLTEPKLEGIAWTSTMKTFAVYGTVSLQPPHRWNLVFKNVNNLDTTTFEGFLDVRSRIVRGRWKNDITGASGILDLKNIGDADKLSLVPNPLDLGWKLQFLDYTKMDTALLAQYYNRLEMPTIASKISSLQLTIEECTGLSHSVVKQLFEVDDKGCHEFMRAHTVLMNLRHVWDIVLKGRREAVSSPESKYHIPVADPIFGLVCGLEGILDLNLRELVEYISQTGQQPVTPVRRVWPPLTGELSQSIRSLGLHANRLRRVTGRELLSMDVAQLTAVGIGRVTSEIFDFFREYVDFLRNRDARIAASNVDELLPIALEMENEAVVYELLRISPESYTNWKAGIDDDTLASKRANWDPAIQRLMRRYEDDQVPSDSCGDSGNTLVTGLSVRSLNRAGRTVSAQGPTSYEGSHHTAYDISQDYDDLLDKYEYPEEDCWTFSLKLCILILSVLCLLILIAPCVILATKEDNSNTGELYSEISVVPMYLSSVIVFVISMLGIFGQGCANHRVSPLYYVQMTVFAILVGIGLWSLISRYPQDMTPWERSHFLGYFVRTLAVFCAVEVEFWAILKNLNPDEQRTLPWGRSSAHVHRAVILFTIVTTVEMVLFLVAIDAVQFTKLVTIWIGDLLVIICFAYAYCKWARKPSHLQRYEDDECGDDERQPLLNGSSSLQS